MPRGKGMPNTPQSIIDEIVARHKAGVTCSELAEKYAKPYKTIKNMITRENNKVRRSEFGLQPVKRGHKPAATLQEYRYENQRLKRENELLRDFLHLAGRK